MTHTFGKEVEPAAAGPDFEAGLLEAAQRSGVDLQRYYQGRNTPAPYVEPNPVVETNIDWGGLVRPVVGLSTIAVGLGAVVSAGAALAAEVALFVSANWGYVLAVVLIIGWGASALSGRGDNATPTANPGGSAKGGGAVNITINVANDGGININKL